MGWASATDLFDGAVDVALDFIPGHTDIVVRAVVDRMYTTVDWDDWDTQQESKYYTDHLIHIMLALDEIDRDDYDWWMEEYGKGSIAI